MIDLPYRLETERLILRPFTLKDRAALCAVFDDPYARRFYPGWADPAMADRWIRRNLTRYEEEGHGLLAACLSSSGELIGDCGLSFQAIDQGRELEVGYHLRADQRGRGLATEAAIACLNHGFGSGECPRLVSMVHPDNHASRAVAQRIHRRERRFMRLGDRYHLFYTTRADWREATSTAND